MSAAYLLFVLVPLAAVAYLIWDYRRKTQARRAASAERLQDMLAASGAPAGRRSPVDDATEAQLREETGSRYLARERLLTAPQTLLYYLLKTGLPEHLVFGRVGLGSLIEVGEGIAPRTREDEMRRLRGYDVDFVVTDRSMRPLAVVELRASGALHEEQRAVARKCVDAAGVRYLVLDAARLPRKEDMRSLVLGSAASEAPSAMDETGAQDSMR